jgi:hypothetical protein
MRPVGVRVSHYEGSTIFSARQEFEPLSWGPLPAESIGFFWSQLSLTKCTLHHFTSTTRRLKAYSFGATHAISTRRDHDVTSHV